MRAICLALCLMLPTAGLAEEPAVAADQPTAAALTPSEPAPQPAVEQARWCGTHGGCHGGRSKAKWIVLTGVAGTVLTAVAVGVAVGVATQNRTGAPATP